MKKSVICFLNIAVIASLICMSAFAAPLPITAVESAAEISFDYVPEQLAQSFSEYETPNGISFVLSNDGTLTVSGDGMIETFPAEIDEKAVKKLVLSDGITAVGEYVFYSCENLAQITAPDTLLYIGEKAFDNTKFLLDKSNGSVYIGKVLYTYKGEIASDGAFELADGTLGIADNALFARTEITEIVIPDTVKAIGERAFYGCTSLERVSVGTGLSYVGTQAFFSTPWLAAQDGQVVIGKTLYSYIGNEANVEVETSVEYISGGAFAHNTTILETVLPDSVKYICENAFYGCTALESISFGDGLLRVGADAFYATKWLDNQNDGVVYASNVAVTYKGEMPNDAEIEIKEGTVTLEDSLFENKTSLYKLTVPESVTYIGKNAFEGCLNLTIYAPVGSFAEKYALDNGIPVYAPESTDAVLASGQTDTYTWTLYKDGKLEFDGTGEISALPSEIDRSSVISLMLSEGITAIGESVFEQCDNLSYADFPESLEYVGKNAFYGTKWLGDAPSGTVYAGKVLYKYKGASAPAAITEIAVKDGTVSISNEAFVNTYEISAVTLPSSLACVGEKAFYGCRNLETVNGGENVAYVGTDAFYGTEWFDLLSEGVVYLGKTLYAYKGEAADGTTVNIAEGTVSISDYAFFGLYGLCGVTMPETLETIGNEAFAYCDNLGKLSVPVTVENIGDNAFDGCENAVLTVVKGSKAYTYAKDNGIAFEIAGFVIGDVNEDGRVNVKDAILLSQYLVGNATITETQLESADVYTADDLDGAVNVNDKDLALLAKHLAGFKVTLG